MTSHQSWGNYPQAETQYQILLQDRTAPFPDQLGPFLPRGLGRSYGDSCLNERGTLISSQQLNHFILFDRTSGIMRCEGGVTFDEILKICVPAGWFLPVTPGTKFITVAGAIANDVHGKNHHKAGNFGHHVEKLELLRSTSERIICSRDSNAEFFAATIGGLGLTGFITWAEFKLTKIASAWISQEQIQFNSLQEFFQLSEEASERHDFTASWADCVGGKSDVRGIFIRGNSAAPRTRKNLKVHSGQGLKQVPFFLPDKLLNKYTVKTFNAAYFHKTLGKKSTGVVHYDPFYYPLDSIQNWNKIYGRRGFLQYQFVVPFKGDHGLALSDILKHLKKSQMGSFLAVLKTFGPIESEGMLSFPKEGVTLALDFPNVGSSLLKVLEDCDLIVRQAGGAVYPAKDARMSKESFEAFFPRLGEFEKYTDPKFSSSFWRRVR